MLKLEEQQFLGEATCALSEVTKKLIYLLLTNVLQVDEMSL